MDYPCEESGDEFETFLLSHGEADKQWLLRIHAVGAAALDQLLLSIARRRTGSHL